VSPSSWDIAGLAVKALVYAATLAAAGGVFFLGYSASLLDAEDRISIRRRLRTLGLVAIAASLTHILLTVASMSGDASGMLDPGLLALVWRSGEGRSVMVRSAGLLLAFPVLCTDRRPGVIAFTGAAAAATSFAWTGHTHADQWRFATPLLAVHLLAAAFWVGAFWPLRLLARGEGARRVAPAAARFGRMALVAVGALLLAGIPLLGFLLGSLHELWQGNYGRTACIKLGLVASVLAVAAYNKFRLTPRLLAADQGAARALRASIAAEMALAGGVLLATAALTTLTGPPAAS
jgi:copper resistance protein D